MALRGTGVLAIWNDVTAGGEDEFVAWHVREHIPERVSLPGFTRGRRYVALDGEPAFFNFYEGESAATFVSEAYKARLDDPTPWTRRVIATFLATTRTVCDVALSEGTGVGAFVETIRVSLAGDPADFLAGLGERMRTIRATGGIVGLHVLRGLAEASMGGSVEKTIRSAPDAIADWVVLVEATDPEPLDGVRRSALAAADLVAIGADPGLARGIYRLQFALDHVDAIAAAGQEARRRDAVPG
jgi:hypothetical protein